MQFPRWTQDTVVLYSVHVELAHIGIGITFDRNEIWAWDLYHSTALDEAVKNSAPLSAKNAGKIVR